MKVVTYGRVSTVLHQDVETQMKELRELCKNKNWEIIKEYTDVISGSKDKRVSLDELRKEGLLGKFDCVVVYSVDRLSRSVKHFCELMKEFDDLNIKVFFLREGIDTTQGVMGKCLLQLMSVFGELERSLIRERIRLGVKNYIRKNGRWTKRKSYISSKVKNNVIELRKSGLGIRKISTQMKIGVGTTYKILKEVS